MAATHPLEMNLEDLRTRMRAATVRDEATVVTDLLHSLEDVRVERARAEVRAGHWVQEARETKHTGSFLESMLESAPLDSVSGRALMALAEALLRTTDPTRANQLIAERLEQIRSAKEGSDGPMLIRAAFALLSSAGRGSARWQAFVALVCGADGCAGRAGRAARGDARNGRSVHLGRNDRGRDGARP